MSLKTGTVLITGASSGFGAATARLIAKRWPQASLMLTGRRLDRLEAVAAEIGPRASVYPFDVSSRRAVELFAQDHAEKLAHVSVLVNNAGLAAGLDNFQDASLDDWDQMIDTNVKGLLYITRAVIPHLIKRGEAHIVNIGSIAGRLVYPKGHVYNATKFAVRALNEAMRIDTLGTGVRVTSIDPGMAETEFSLVRFKGDETKAKAVYNGLTPLAAEDIADAILWSLERPAHVNVQEILLMPTAQASPRDVARTSAQGEVRK
jgi:3-hydroxy acid dehydrogenase/malonic semialdehyde reductase